MTMELENRIAELADHVAEQDDRIGELETFRAWVLDPDADEDYDTPPTADELARKTRDELNELAELAGVESPAELATKADVADAIVAKRDDE